MDAQSLIQLVARISYRESFAEMRGQSFGKHGLHTPINDRKLTHSFLID